MKTRHAAERIMDLADPLAPQEQRPAFPTRDSSPRAQDVLIALQTPMSGDSARRRHVTGLFAAALVVALVGAVVLVMASAGRSRREPAGTFEPHRPTMTHPAPASPTGDLQSSAQSQQTQVACLATASRAFTAMVLAYQQATARGNTTSEANTAVQHALTLLFRDQPDPVLSGRVQTLWTRNSASLRTGKISQNTLVSDSCK